MENTNNTNHSGNGEHNNTPPHQPIFNLPTVVLWLVGAIILIHLVVNYLLSPQTQHSIRVLFGFHSAIFSLAIENVFSDHTALYYIWSPIMHAFLHADWTHVLMNVGFMVAFGAPLAMRLGSMRFLILFALSAIGGAMLFWLMNTQTPMFLIGASGAISGFMGAASRFAFQPNIGEDGIIKRGLNVKGRSLTLAQCLKDRKFINFFAIWMVINLVFGTVLSSVLSDSGNIAWEAHIGGFLTGIFTFSFLDRR